MDAYKGQMKLVACGGYGWKWSGSYGLANAKTKGKIRPAIRRTVRRKLKHSQHDQ